MADANFNINFNLTGQNALTRASNTLGALGTQARTLQSSFNRMTNANRAVGTSFNTITSGANNSILSVNRLTMAFQRYARYMISSALVIGGVKLFKDAIKGAAEFEYEMARVKRITNATEKEFKDLTKLTRVVGIETVFTPQEAAKSIRLLSQYGMTAKDLLTGLTASGKMKKGSLIDTVTSLSTVAGKDLPLDRAAETVIKIKKIFSASDSELQKMVNSLTVMTQKSNFLFSDWQNFFKGLREGPTTLMQGFAGGEDKQNVFNTLMALGSGLRTKFTASMSGRYITIALKRIADIKEDFMLRGEGTPAKWVEGKTIPDRYVTTRGGASYGRGYSGFSTGYKGGMSTRYGEAEGFSDYFMQKKIQGYSTPGKWVGGGAPKDSNIIKMMNRLGLTDKDLEREGRFLPVEELFPKIKARQEIKGLSPAEIEAMNKTLLGARGGPSIMEMFGETYVKDISGLQEEYREEIKKTIDWQIKQIQEHYKGTDLMKKKLDELKESLDYDELTGSAAVYLDKLISETAQARDAQEGLKKDMLDTYQGISKLLEGSWGTVKKTFGDIMLPAISKEILEPLKNWINESLLMTNGFDTFVTGMQNSFRDVVRAIVTGAKEIISSLSFAFNTAKSVISSVLAPFRLFSSGAKGLENTLQSIGKVLGVYFSFKFFSKIISGFTRLGNTISNFATRSLSRFRGNMAITQQGMVGLGQQKDKLIPNFNQFGRTVNKQGITTMSNMSKATDKANKSLYNVRTNDPNLKNYSDKVNQVITKKSIRESYAKNMIPPTITRKSFEKNILAQEKAQIKAYTDRMKSLTDRKNFLTKQSVALNKANAFMSSVSPTGITQFDRYKSFKQIQQLRADKSLSVYQRNKQIGDIRKNLGLTKAPSAITIDKYTQRYEKHQAVLNSRQAKNLQKYMKINEKQIASLDRKYNTSIQKTIAEKNPRLYGGVNPLIDRRYLNTGEGSISNAVRVYNKYKGAARAGTFDVRTVRDMNNKMQGFMAKHLQTGTEKFINKATLQKQFGDKVGASWWKKSRQAMFDPTMDKAKANAILNTVMQKSAQKSLSKGLMPTIPVQTRMGEQLGIKKINDNLYKVVDEHGKLVTRIGKTEDLRGKDLKNTVAMNKKMEKHVNSAVKTGYLSNYAVKQIQKSQGTYVSPFAPKVIGKNLLGAFRQMGQMYGPMLKVGGTLMLAGKAIDNIAKHGANIPAVITGMLGDFTSMAGNFLGIFSSTWGDAVKYGGEWLGKAATSMSTGKTIEELSVKADTDTLQGITSALAEMSEATRQGMEDILIKVKESFPTETDERQNILAQIKYMQQLKPDFANNLIKQVMTPIEDLDLGKELTASFTEFLNDYRQLETDKFALVTELMQGTINTAANYMEKRFGTTKYYAGATRYIKTGEADEFSRTGRGLTPRDLISKSNVYSMMYQDRLLPMLGKIGGVNVTEQNISDIMNMPNISVYGKDLQNILLTREKLIDLAVQNYEGKQAGELLKGYFTLNQTYKEGKKLLEDQLNVMTDQLNKGGYNAYENAGMYYTEIDNIKKEIEKSDKIYAGAGRNIGRRFLAGMELEIGSKEGKIFDKAAVMQQYIDSVSSGNTELRKMLLTSSGVMKEYFTTEMTEFITQNKDMINKLGFDVSTILPQMFEGFAESGIKEFADYIEGVKKLLSEFKPEIPIPEVPKPTAKQNKMAAIQEKKDIITGKDLPGKKVGPFLPKIFTKPEEPLSKENINKRLFKDPAVGGLDLIGDALHYYTPEERMKRLSLKNKEKWVKEDFDLINQNKDLAVRLGLMEGEPVVKAPVVKTKEDIQKEAGEKVTTDFKDAAKSTIGISLDMEEAKKTFGAVMDSLKANKELNTVALDFDISKADAPFKELTNQIDTIKKNANIEINGKINEEFAKQLSNVAATMQTIMGLSGVVGGKSEGTGKKTFQSGGYIPSDGYVYAHGGERIVSKSQQASGLYSKLGNEGNGGNTFHIHAAAGMDEEKLARLVAEKVAAVEGRINYSIARFEDGRNEKERRNEFFGRKNTARIYSS